MHVLAQADAAGLTPLEYDLLQSAGLIGSIYGMLLLAGLIANIVLFIRWRSHAVPVRPAMERLLRRPWEGGQVAVLIGILATAFVALLAYRDSWLAWTASMPLAPASRMVLLQSIMFHVLGLLAVAAMMAHGRISGQEGFGFRWASMPGDALRGVIGMLAALPVLLVATLVFHLAMHLLGHQTTLQDVAFVISDEKNRWMRAYFVLLAVGLAPVFEEILFRGMLLPVLARRCGGWAALLVTSFLFAVIHGHLPSFVTLFALSAALSLAYIFSGSITVPIVMHALFNSITIAILLLLN